VTDSSDEELLRAHVAGDPTAFDELVRRHRDRLWSVALRTTGNREDAADAVQEAFLSAFRTAGTFRGESAVMTWLHRIVVNAAVDRIRRRRPAESLDVMLDAGRPVAATPDPAPGRVTALAVRAALARLPLDQRLAVVLVDLEGYSVDEAATVLGVPAGTVKSRCWRGRAKLAALLRPDGNDRPAEGVQSAPPESPRSRSAREGSGR
jgi:RNA polymerase sigma-70 factor (ECF subfamily)